MLCGDNFGGSIDQHSLFGIVNGLPHPAAILTAGGSVIHENVLFQALCNRTRSPISRTDFFATLTGVQREKIGLMTRECAKERLRTHRFDWQLPGADTATHVAELTLLTSDDAVAGLLCQLLPSQSADNLRLQYLMDSFDQGVWDYDLETQVFTASKTWRDLRGLTSDHKIDMTKGDWLDSIHPEDRDQLVDALDAQKDGGEKSIIVQYRHMHQDGHWVWILCRASIVEADASGRPLRIVGTDTDISDAVNSQASTNRLAGKLKLAMEASGIGIFEHNPATQQVHWDDRMLEIYGITDGQHVRSENIWETYLHPDDYAETVAYAEECQRHNRDIKRDFRIVQPGGEVRYIRSLARNVETSNQVTKLIGVNIDVTEDYLRAQELEAARAQLEYDALHDGLTGLGNRRSLDQTAAAFFSRAGPDSHYAAMQIDLDLFKAVNDTRGHAAGDFILSNVAQLIRDAVGDLGSCYRVGGDEFTVFFEEAPDKQQLNDISQSLVDAIGTPMEFEGQPCKIGASVGYSTGQGAPKTHSTIFTEADTALYAAKRAGRSTYRAYCQKVGDEFQVVTDKRKALRDAISSGQLLCHFQPQFDAETLDVIGAEALVRWQCPQRGLLSPYQFLSNAAGSGLIVAIDQFVFQRALDFQTDLSAEGNTCPRLSVNISREWLEDEDFLPHVRAKMKDHHRFVFELLETTFYDTPGPDLRHKLDTLREMGIWIEMDDFGTGHASVKALQAIRPNGVKIDRSLVEPLGTRTQQLEILQNLSNIARIEGARVVVEGLESGPHMAAIRMLDCDVLQGFALQRPMPEADFAALLHDPVSHHAAAQSGLVNAGLNSSIRH